MITKALEFATRAHLGQTRKYTGEPYINHVKAVADAVQNQPHSSMSDVIIAILHDVVEDTATTFTDLQNEFGAAIARGVWWLTDTDTALGNRNTRKMLDRTRLAAAPRNIQDIKLCDLLDNAGTIMQHDAAFGERYMGEKHELLLVMGGSVHLWTQARDLVRDQPFYTDPEWRKRYGVE